MRLSDDELRREVAKARGWSSAFVCYYYILKDPTGYEVIDSFSRDEAGVWRTAPDYPYDIAAAWPLLEGMRHARCEIMISGRPGRWRLGIMPHNADCWTWVSEGPVATMVCRAYLCWKEGAYYG